jgi:hypothetical protein
VDAQTSRHFDLGEFLLFVAVFELLMAGVLDDLHQKAQMNLGHFTVHQHALEISFRRLKQKNMKGIHVLLKTHVRSSPFTHRAGTALS